MVTIKKNVRESLGMRIGGGIGSNEGDTPIYVANIHPHGCIGKSKQMKVNSGEISAHIFFHFCTKKGYRSRGKKPCSKRKPGLLKKIDLAISTGKIV